jgi:hypothetical protein
MLLCLWILILSHTREYELNFIIQEERISKPIILGCWPHFNFGVNNFVVYLCDTSSARSHMSAMYGLWTFKADAEVWNASIWTLEILDFNDPLHIQIYDQLPYPGILCNRMASQNQWVSSRSRRFWSHVSAVLKCVAGSHLGTNELDTRTCMDNYTWQPNDVHNCMQPEGVG